MQQGIDDNTKKILNDKNLIENREKWFQRLDNIFHGVPDESSQGQHFVISGIHGTAPDAEKEYTAPEEWINEAAADLASQIEAAPVCGKFMPPCIEPSLYGVHFIDKILGAEVFYKDDQWYNKYLDHEVGELKACDIEESETWQLAKRHAKHFLALDIKLPLFGMPTLSSPLNIAVNLYGEEILAAMLLEPESAEHDLDIIEDVIKQAHRWYIETIPKEQLQSVISWERTQPKGYGQICGCTTQLLSPELYERFIMERDNRILGLYQNGGMLHLCGNHQALIPLFASMENLKSVQLNDRAAEDLQFYVDGLRKDQVIYVIPCSGMTVEQAVAIAGKRGIVLITHDNAERKNTN